MALLAHMAVKNHMALLAHMAVKNHMVFIPATLRNYNSMLSLFVTFTVSMKINLTNLKPIIVIADI